MKLLVVNADDFGLDPAVNAAITKAHTDGLLTSASLLIAAPHATEAVEFARSHPKLGVGLHLCLVEGRSAALPDKIPSLATETGELPLSPFVLSARLSSNKKLDTDIEIELRAQISQFMATGLRPTHFDTHQHTHLHPRVLSVVTRLAREHGIAFIRAPVEPLWPTIRSSRQRLTRKLARWTIFATLGSWAKRQLRRQGFRTVDRAVGVLDPGHLTEPFLASYLPELPDGLTEIFFHPADRPAEPLLRIQRGYEHAAELQALCSPHLRQLINESGIRLTNFRELSLPAS
ncbi:MAG: hopanoid biosynthesis-associated protein HpnK [Verrucomicrobiia bacterium]